MTNTFDEVELFFHTISPDSPTRRTALTTVLFLIFEILSLMALRTATIDFEITYQSSLNLRILFFLRKLQVFVCERLTVILLLMCFSST